MLDKEYLTTTEIIYPIFIQEGRDYLNIMKKKNAYKKMWFLLGGMVVSAVVAALAFTTLIYSVVPQFGTLLIAGGALLSLLVWMALILIALDWAYEPGRPTKRNTKMISSELKSGVAES